MQITLFSSESNGKPMEEVHAKDKTTVRLRSQYHRRPKLVQGIVVQTARSFTNSTNEDVN
jgi:hypothetical protein